MLDGTKGVLRWYDRDLGALKAGAPYSLGMELNWDGLRTPDNTITPTAQSARWTVQVDPSLDKTPPPAPFVSYLPANRLQRADFEGSWPQDVDIRRSAWVVPDQLEGATGSGSVRVVNLMRRDFFSVFLRKGAYDVKAFPQLDFDYKFEPKSGLYGAYNMNLVSVVNGDMQIVPFIGGPSGYPPFRENTIGNIAGTLADGAWHHASVNLGALLTRRYPKADALQAEYLATWATGPRGYSNPQGASLWLGSAESGSRAYHSIRAVIQIDAGGHRHDGKGDHRHLGGQPFHMSIGEKVIGAVLVSRCSRAAVVDEKWVEGAGTGELRSGRRRVI